MVIGRGTLTKCQQNYTLKRTKLRHFKRDFRECMPPEHLTNAETISNIIYILQTYNIKRIFAAIPYLYSCAQWCSGAGTHGNGVPTREF